jgi:hypothetical protein
MLAGWNSDELISHGWRWASHVVAMSLSQRHSAFVHSNWWKTTIPSRLAMVGGVNNTHEVMRILCNTVISFVYYATNT